MPCALLLLARPQDTCSCLKKGQGHRAWGGSRQDPSAMSSGTTFWLSHWLGAPGLDWVGVRNAAQLPQCPDGPSGNDLALRSAVPKGRP